MDIILPKLHYLAFVVGNEGTGRVSSVIICNSICASVNFVAMLPNISGHENLKASFKEIILTYITVLGMC